MKTFIVTILDSRSTAENPVKPIQKTCTADKLPTLLSEMLDSDHTAVIAFVDSY